MEIASRPALSLPVTGKGRAWNAAHDAAEESMTRMIVFFIQNLWGNSWREIGEEEETRRSGERQKGRKAEESAKCGLKCALSWSGQTGQQVGFDLFGFGVVEVSSSTGTSFVERRAPETHTHPADRGGTSFVPRGSQGSTQLQGARYIRKRSCLTVTASLSRDSQPCRVTNFAHNRLSSAFNYAAEEVQVHLPMSICRSILPLSKNVYLLPFSFLDSFKCRANRCIIQWNRVGRGKHERYRDPKMMLSVSHEGNPR